MPVTDFKQIDHLHHSEFEEFVKDLFESSGWSEAHLTKVGGDFKYGDGGVDIFAYRGGRKFAIEVKQRDTKFTVDVKALNQLVAGAKLAKAPNMILVTNSYFTSEVKIRALRLGVELIDREGLQNLWHARQSEIGREIKPRKYQSDLIDECIEKYDFGANRLLIEMATGLGKTYTVALLIKLLLQKNRTRERVLFIAHQVEILLQTVTAFKNVFGIGRYSFSACFSGASLENTDFVFASFDTLYSRISELNSDDFDYIIIDEAHHSPASTYSQVIRNFDPKLLVGLTATPYRLDNKDVTEFFGGERGHVGKYDLVWALANNKLAFPRYHVLLDDLDQNKIDQLESGLSIADLDKKLFLHRKDEEVVKIIERTVEEKGLTDVKGIVFCRSISHLRHLIKFFKIGSAVCVHSKQTQDERRENIRKFREESFSYILVCDLFNEGIDIPEANLLVFMRYTGSQTIWLQQLGRGLRKTATKTHIDVLDFVGSLERLDQINGFARAVNNTRRDPGESSSEKNLPAFEIHDSSIDVIYSQSAAKVLDLIKDLKYRLNTRSELIAKLQKFYSDKGLIPDLNELEICLDNVSVDQVATHFESYFQYLKAALPEISLQKIATKKVEEFIFFYKKNNLVEPSPRAICTGISFGVLLFISEKDLDLLLMRKHAECFKPTTVDSSINSSVSHDKQKYNIPKEDLVGEKKSHAFDKNIDLIETYENRIQTRSDFNDLPEDEKELIIKKFRSPSVFLMKIREYREKI